MSDAWETPILRLRSGQASRRRISPGLGNFVAVLDGAGHETKLDPLAALLESFKSWRVVAVFHCVVCPSVCEK